LSLKRSGGCVATGRMDWGIAAKYRIRCATKVARRKS
jgi:hypothetical protein